MTCILLVEIWYMYIHQGKALINIYFFVVYILRQEATSEKNASIL